MNKKFSTFLVSMLLAGGMFSANGQVAKKPSEASVTGFYHVLKFDDRVSDGDNVLYGNAWSLAVKNGALIAEEDESAVTKENVWKVEEVKVNTSVIGYRFTNANGVKLQFDKDGNFTTKDSEAEYSIFGRSKSDGNKIKAVNTEDKGTLYITQEGSTYKLSDAGTFAQLFTLPTYELPIDKLNEQLGDGFGLTIGKTKYNKTTGSLLDWDSAYDLKGNVFTGKLTAVNAEDEKALDDEGWSGTFLKNEDGKYLVLTDDTWGELANDLQNGNKKGYKFAAMTVSQIKKAGDAILAKTFTFTQPNELTAEPLEVKAGDDYELMVAVVDGEYYLTTGDAADKVNSGTTKVDGSDNPIDIVSDGTSQLVGTASFTNNYQPKTETVAEKTATENTYVKFGMDNLADYTLFNDVVWNIQRDLIENGKVKETLVAGPTTKDTKTWTPAAQVAFAYPEGQWLWNGEKFVNRESASELTLVGLREVEGEDYTAGNDTYVFTTGNYQYTFTKAGEPGENITLGYLNETNDALLQNAFYVGTPIKATGDTVYIAKDEDNVLYLSEDKAEAVAFRLTKEEQSKDSGIEIIRHYTTYASSKTDDGTAKDILNLYKYLLTDAATGEKLAYDGVNEKFILSEDAKAYSSLVLKNKDVNLYNLVKGLKTDDETKDNKYIGDKFDDTFASATKLYGAHNTAELQEADKAYDLIANDLFVLTPVEAGQHVSDIEGDTIKIFREAENNFYLYAGKDNFLELTSFVDPTDNGGAFYVDSAAGKGTWRQEYLLAVDVVDHKDGMMCPYNPLHNDQTWRDKENGGKPCADAVPVQEFKTGRYLVNLVDSAKAATENDVKDADNKFMFQNYLTKEPYYRLGFVAATHVEDSLIIASTNDTIIVSSNNFADAKVCDFAFHYVADDAFIIETAYDYTEEIDDLTEEVKYTATPGYIKYHNGVPVVTPVREEAEVFLFEETTEKPTDNEEISTSEVKVIAGNGQITIAGAAGKQVVVSNILGQVVANTVITSDNATIAAPQGIVVVAVEGEEAVKAIVK